LHATTFQEAPNSVAANSLALVHLIQEIPLPKFGAETGSFPPDKMMG